MKFYSQLNVVYFGYALAHVWNGNNWNNNINFIVLGLLPDFHEWEMHIWANCHCYLNGCYSKETSLYNNNYVYYCYFQISLWLNYIMTDWNTNFVSQGKWFFCSRKTWLLEKWIAFLIFIFFKVQFEAKVLELCFNFVQCSGVVIFEVLYFPEGVKKKDSFDVWKCPD